MIPARFALMRTTRTVMTHDRLTTNDLAFEVEAVLAWHDDDAKATIATLLSDIRHLRLQLSRTEGKLGPRRLARKDCNLA